MSAKSEKKNLMRSTSKRPLRVSLLGPHMSSKSAIMSIISNEKSIENYYPTLQNSPMLIQFQPKNFTTRALLDINVTSDDLESVHVLGNPEFVLPPRVAEAVIEADGRSPKDVSTSTSTVIRYTNNYYDLDYTRPNYFGDGTPSPASHSPVASFSVGSSAGPSSARGSVPLLTAIMNENHPNSHDDDGKYRPPVTTPILMELIDTPGVDRNDLIPFLEKGLDSKLASDILRNLTNEADSEGRSRVKPLITGSGMSELNAVMDGYILTFSCIPEIDDEAAPPPYEETDSNSGSDDDLKGTADAAATSAQNSFGQPREKSTTSHVMHTGFEAIDIVRALYTSIVEAWKQYMGYHHGWEVGQEFDVYSLNYSFKQLWKKMGTTKDVPDSTLLSNARREMPPILIAATHVDHELASPLVKEEGRKLAEELGCGFIEVSCEFDNWRNVEEAFGLLIRDRIEQKRDGEAYQ